MSIFQDFARLQNQVDRLMGDFGSTYGQPLGRRGGRRRPAQQQLGGWVDPFDMLPGFDEDVFFNTPMLLGGGQGQQQKLTSGKEQEETKMIDVDEKSAQATQLTQQQPQVGTAMTTFQPDRLLRARVNIEDAKDKYIVTAEMPSFDKQNIKVNVTDDGLLTIKGEQSQEWVDQAKDKKYLHAERTFSNVERTLRLPKGVDTSKIQANLENGVLHVQLPKLPEAEKKQTNIQIS